MKPYHKIRTLFNREIKKKGKVIEGQWSTPEFKELANIEWVWEEKIDGSNIRIIYEGGSVIFEGKEKDDIIGQTPGIKELLNSTFDRKIMYKLFGEKEVCLYGEVYGRGVNGSRDGDNYSDQLKFILFDCKIFGWWLERGNLIDISSEKKLNIDLVPVVGSGSLLEAVNKVKGGFPSQVYDKNQPAEGLIMRPKVSLFDRKGDRIIGKLKTNDFKR